MEHFRARLQPLPIALLWLTASVADAAHLVPRFANDSLPNCEADCKVAEIVGHYTWQRQIVTATYTAATLVYIVNNRTNTTRTETRYNDLPDGLTIPPTNAKGTQTAAITVETAAEKTATIELAYPTGYVRYPHEYYWAGTLPTIDALGKSVCSTATQSASVEYAPHVTPAQPPPDDLDEEDPKGWIYSLLDYACWTLPNPTAWSSGDAAPTLCQVDGRCGAFAVKTASLLTETATEHEDTAPPPTPPPSTNPPPANNNPPPAQNNPPPAQNNPPPAQNNPPPAQNSPPPGQNNPPPAENNPPAQNNIPALAAPVQGGNAQAPQPTAAAGAGSGGNQPGQQDPNPTPAPIVIGSQTISANAQNNFVIAGQTLSQGGQIIAAGTTVSLARGGSVAVVNGATQSLLSPAPTGAAIIAVGGQTITANSQGQLVIAGQTVAAGGSAITVGSGASRTTISLTTDASGKTVAAVNGKLSTLSSAPTKGVGGYVAGGIGVEQFPGAAGRLRMGDWWIGLGMCVIMRYLM